ncbi:polysaccharide biosynthesis protein, partial [Butyricicoccus sp. 1XD8-22]
MKLCRKARESLPNDSRQLMKGAVILTLAAFIIKILSAVYRVPFQNIVGDTGFYIYQQVYPLYGIASVLAASGFPVIISRIVAKK